MQTVKLIDNVEIAPQTILLRFFRPPNYHFLSGQYANVTLQSKNYPDYDYHTRTLSFASNPQSPTLDFIVRVRPSGFKRGLKELNSSDAIILSDPMGKFDFSVDRPNVAITGGIGIAPLLSRFCTKPTNHQVFLIWTNQTVSSVPLLNEVKLALQAWKHKIHLILTRESAPKKPFEFGRISLDWLNRHELINPAYNYLLCGSPGLVTEIANDLLSANIPKRFIKTEAFTGY